jgi:hypothetical protein
MPHALIAVIDQAFSQGVYPGDEFLVGSRDGCEPYDTVSQFFGRTDWRTVEPSMLDGCYDALSFFSEAGFRFFLPAYLTADVRGQLQTADPVFPLTHGFLEVSHPYRGTTQVFDRRSGGDVLLNPRRYGAITWRDHARWRLAVFCREEASAIVEYLRFRRARDEDGLDTAAINAALSGFWLERAVRAPPAADLEAHLAAEREFAAELERRRLNTDPPGGC